MAGQHQPYEHVMKLQRALYSTVENPPILAYNQDRSLQFQVHMNADDIEAVFGLRHKVFCKCRVVNGSLEIGDEVEDRDW